MKDDPTILRIRETRHQISEKFDHNIEKIVNHYIILQEKHKKRLIKPRSKKKKRAVT
jgi:hypothetical protein